MPVSLWMTIGQYLAPELAAIERQLCRATLTYSFGQTTDLLAAWEIAHEQQLIRALQPTAIVWLQSRPGEFLQTEVDEVRAASPAARHFVVTGCLSEGELRSGRPLRDLVRLAWNLGAETIVDQIRSGLSQEAGSPGSPAPWLAIHAPQFETYEGLALVCQSLGYGTLWQPDHLPILSSAPAIRLFYDWQSWAGWHGTRMANRSSRAAEILLLSFPRLADFQRAAEVGIASVLPLPLQRNDLETALVGNLPPATLSAAPRVNLRLVG